MVVVFIFGLDCPFVALVVVVDDMGSSWVRSLALPADLTRTLVTLVRSLSDRARPGFPIRDDFELFLSLAPPLLASNPPERGMEEDIAAAPPTGPAALLFRRSWLLDRRRLELMLHFRCGH